MLFLLNEDTIHWFGTHPMSLCEFKCWFPYRCWLNEEIWISG